MSDLILNVITNNEFINMCIMVLIFSIICYLFAGYGDNIPYSIYLSIIMFSTYFKFRNMILHNGTKGILLLVLMQSIFILVFILNTFIFETIRYWFENKKQIVKE